MKNVLIILTCVFLTSCAAGRADDGSIVTGFKIASMPETAGEFAKLATGFLPPPWNLIAGAGATLLLGGTGTIAATARGRRHRAVQREADAAARADAAWDEAQSRTLLMVTPPPAWRGVGPDPALQAPAETPLT